MDEKMKFNAIICEYNPFHNGHKYHLESVKAQNNAPTVAIMSGSFTQRGDISVTNKFIKAETAVKNGVDLVVELPTVYAVGSAESFARGGVGIAEGMGCIKNLCFGAECADKEKLIKAAESFENKSFKTALREYLGNGCYYPSAVENAVRDVCGDELAEIVKSPNNILAVEYIKAAEKLDFIVTKRKGADHDSAYGEGDIRSASQLREMIYKGKDISPFSPAEIENYADIKRLERVILYRLRTMSAEELSLLPDVTEGLENRIVEAVKSSVSLDEILNKVKTKRYTMARLRRIIICALLGITAEMSKKNPPYIRALAFNNKGAEIMREIKRNGTVPLITNVADGYAALDDEAKRIFEIDLRATDIYSLACESVEPCASDFKRKLTIMNTNN